MARIFIDGFESGGYDLWDGESGATVISSAGLDMNGDYCLDLNSTYAYVYKDVTPADEMYFSFLWRRTNSTYSEAMLALSDIDTWLAYFYEAGNNVRATIGSTIVATGTKTIGLNTTYRIEIYLKIADSGGRVVVKIDGVTDIDFTGDTLYGAYTQFNRVRLGHGPSVSWTTSAYFDNFIMDDADWIGDTNIQAVVPTGAGNTTGWTPSAGNNWECVDEKPFNDADYVSINAIDTVDTYAAGNMAGTISEVKCVQVQSRIKTDGTPTPTNLKLVVRSGGTDYLSGNKTVPAAAKSFSHIWETNPADSAAWEETDVNAMEIGVKSAA